MYVLNEISIKILYKIFLDELFYIHVIEDRNINLSNIQSHTNFTYFDNVIVLDKFQNNFNWALRMTETFIDPFQSGKHYK